MQSLLSNFLDKHSIDKKRKERITLLEETIKKVEHRTALQKEKRLSRIDPDDDKSSSNADRDWTRSYQNWNVWADEKDTEALQKKLREKKIKMDQMQKRKSTNLAKCFCSHDRNAERKVAEMPLKQRINEIKSFRRDGNSLFQDGCFPKALTKYESALTYYEYCVCNDSKDETMLEDIRIRCLLNAAACYLKLQMFAKGVEYCTQVLDIEKKNAKAYFRRAQLQRCLGNYSLAKADLGNALKINGDCASFRRERELLKARVDQHKKSEHLLAQRMLQQQPAIQMKGQKQENVTTYGNDIHPREGCHIITRPSPNISTSNQSFYNNSLVNRPPRKYEDVGWAFRHYRNRSHCPCHADTLVVDE